MKATAYGLAQSRWQIREELPRSRCLVLGNYTARVQEWGEGPPLVLLPGLAGGTSLVTPLAYCLAYHGYRVISYDLRGEDDCFGRRRPFELADLVEDLNEVVAELCLERPILMGVSFGALIAALWASRQPGRVAGLALQGMNFRFEKSMLRLIAGKVLRHYPLPPDSPFVNQFFNLLFGSRIKDPLVFDFVTSHCWRTDQSVMAHRFQLAERLDLRPHLPALRHVPALLMNGDRDVLAPPTSLAALAAALPQAETRTLPQAGHLAFITHAPVVARQTVEFARQLEERDSAVGQV